MNSTHQDILLVADRVSKHDPASLETNSLEFIEDNYFDAVVAALTELGAQVQHIASTHLLLDQVGKFKNYTVVPLSFGLGGRSKKALVSAICESAGLHYIGADPYTSIVCTDKELSKDYARKFGIAAPESLSFKSIDQIPSSPIALRLPVVVKPVFEGGSIGIDAHSLCGDWPSALDQAKRLFRSLGGPVMFEEFIQGEEICICIMGSKDGPKHVEATKVEVTGVNLNDSVWSMDLKKDPQITKRHVVVTDDLPEGLSTQCLELFDSFEKVDYMRIDGRVDNGVFKLIELSPDANLSSTASFAVAMRAAGFSYRDMWSFLINLS